MGMYLLPSQPCNDPATIVFLSSVRGDRSFGGRGCPTDERSRRMCQAAVIVDGVIRGVPVIGTLQSALPAAVVGKALPFCRTLMAVIQL